MASPTNSKLLPLANDLEVQVVTRLAEHRRNRKTVGDGVDCPSSDLLSAIAHSLNLFARVGRQLIDPSVLNNNPTISDLNRRCPSSHRSKMDANTGQVQGVAPAPSSASDPHAEFKRFDSYPWVRDRSFLVSRRSFIRPFIHRSLFNGGAVGYPSFP